MEFKPHAYQEYAIQRIINQNKIGLFLDMGLGKTVITLTAIEYLMHDSFEVSKVLVIAPKRVAEDTWSRETEKWEHLSDLRVSKVLGSQMKRIEALQAPADIYVINRENTKWLIDYCRELRDWPFDMVVIDELSSFKSNTSQRFKALKGVTPLIDRLVGLTGTPAPNSYMDLWSQVYLLDRGERLGKTITAYRDRYFNPGMRNGYTVFNWNLKEMAKEAINDKLADLCVSMKAEDYLDMPERLDNVIDVYLSTDEMKKYKEFEQEQILQLDGQDVVALNAAAVSGKLQQMANGAVYTTDLLCSETSPKESFVEMHDKKLEALEEILEFNPEPVLVFYNFKHDLIRLQKRFENLKPRVLNGPKDIKDWNDGKIRLLFAHPASVGYGLNIQDGGHIIVWFGLNWSLELYQQANARLYRQGQGKTVIIHHIVTKGTVDEDVMKALERKEVDQNALLESIKARIEKYRKG